MLSSTHLTEMSVPQKAELFGVEIDALTFDEAVSRVFSWVNQKGDCIRYVITPNVNHIVMYQRETAFRTAYEGASLVVPDGRYTTALVRFLEKKQLETINGSDLVPALFATAEKKSSLRVFLLGAMPGVAEQAAANIERRWPNVDVVGTYSPPLGFENDSHETEQMIQRVNAASVDLLVLGLSPPKQEIWISRNQQAIQGGVAICAGATIDFLAGEKSRAPLWMQRSGLEWLHRMITEPRRLLPRYASDGAMLIKLLAGEIWKRVRGRFRG